MQKTARVTTGARVEKHFLDLLELIYRAYYSQPEKKSDTLTLCIQKTDLLKFLIQITWENKLIQNQHYLELSEKMHEIGKMLGGWKKGVESKLAQTKTPHGM